jgi:ABC-type multidrug transport system fused ATPase/permease subunit
VDGCKKRDAGTIWIDGKDIREVNRRWLAERIGVVAQKPIIWNTTILENVAYGSAAERFIEDGTPEKEAQKQRVIKALEQAAAWNQFVNPNPPPRPDGSKPEPGLGLDFQVGEDGSNLSGGQKQRVSIARMLYKNPSLLIFDEVTSALDAGSEKDVMRTLIEIGKGKTCLMIAHRLNTIKHADHIVVLSKSGNIIEETLTKREGDADGKDILGLNGSTASSTSSPSEAKPHRNTMVNPDAKVLQLAHDQLLTHRNGYYKRMWDNQTF